MNNISNNLEDQFRQKLIHKNMGCDNCGSSTHDYRSCKEPTTSWGIILVKVFNQLMLTKDGKMDDVRKFDKIEGIKINNMNEFNEVTNSMNAIKFLIVRRKHSLGYTEFIRGNYKKDNIDGIIYLFQQMTPHEISRIASAESFVDLWDDFWAGDSRKKMFNKKQFTDSKDNFECLKYKIGVDLPLDFYVNKVKPQYVYPEWGFPKGRKQRGESDIECAVREFCEETGYSQQDIKILGNVKPIIENMIGTNGVSYRFIYYLAEDISSNIPIICEKNSNEIGDIGFFTYEETLQLFREYHIEKRNIAKNVFMFYLENLIKKDSFDEQIVEEKVDDDIKNNEKEKWVIEFDDF